MAKPFGLADTIKLLKERIKITVVNLKCPNLPTTVGHVTVLPTFLWVSGVAPELPITIWITTVVVVAQASEKTNVGTVGS